MSSPTSSLPELASGSSSPLGPFDRLSLNSTPEISPNCSICDKPYYIPKVLPCFHTFCHACIESQIIGPENKIKCPLCLIENHLPPQGVDALPSDFAIINLFEKMAIQGSFKIICNTCKATDTQASARCFDCENFLCANCVTAHEYMLCFEKHTLNKFNACNTNFTVDNPVKCFIHKNFYNFYCMTCSGVFCKECASEHTKNSGHEVTYLRDVASKEIANFAAVMTEAKNKSADLCHVTNSTEDIRCKLKEHYEKAKQEINETFNFYMTTIEERKHDLLKELEGILTSKQTSINIMNQKIQEISSKLHHYCVFLERQMKFSTPTELLVYKQSLESKLHSIYNYLPDPSPNIADVEFQSNFQAIQVGVKNTFGYVRHNSDLNPTKPQPIARPNGILSSDKMAQSNGHGGYDPITTSNLLTKRFSSPISMGPFTTSMSDTSYTNGISNGATFSSSIGSNHFSTSSSPVNSFTTNGNGGGFSNGVSDVSTYEKWSSGGNDIFQNGSDTYTINTEPMMEIGKFNAPSLYPLKSQLKRQKMIYHCKFGEFGIMEGQFTEPSGVAVNAQNDIIVADTNNHRIQIFDKEGRFKFQFGECGKRDGQLLYPNRVAVVRNSGDIIVTERSPTHQIQIYNQYGQFVRKFGANILQHPRGVTVDNKGRIIVVECKVMRVIIFDQAGQILTKFGCSKHLEFPNGVVVNDKQEIFISDNRAHCVKVFSYDGNFLRQIGGEGLTNYPIGVCISPSGEILVADNHNNFNITIFGQDGELVNALESKVKHAQCFDVALMDDGSVVLASKDYRLYVYRYMQIGVAMGPKSRPAHYKPYQN